MAINVTLEQRIEWLEAAMARMDEADPEEIDAEEYQRVLGQLVEARKEQEAPA